MVNEGKQADFFSVLPDKTHDFTVCNIDTDSLSIMKNDKSEFSKEEQESLLNELNSFFPEQIKWAHDGVYRSFVVIKAKNYILYDSEKNKLTIKGSGLKASTKEPALKEFIQRLIDALVNDRTNFTEIYNEYAKEIKSVTDIKRYSTRKTITYAVLNAERLNEQKVLDAIKGSDYVEGDRAYFFFKSDRTLCLVEKWDGDYSKKDLLKKLHDTAKIFSTVLDTKTLFPNYALKKNEAAWAAL